jgi:hypothetical protein
MYVHNVEVRYLLCRTLLRRSLPFRVVSCRLGQLDKMAEPVTHFRKMFVRNPDRRL